MNLEIILHSGLATGTVLLFATIGEIFAERSGILNLGVEGMMLLGAMAGFSTSLAFGNPWLGVIAAILAGGILSLAHGVVTINLQADQVVSGLALTFLGTGLALVLGEGLTGQNPPLIPSFDIPGLAAIPFIGPVFFQDHSVLVYIGLVLHFPHATRNAPACDRRKAGSGGHAGRQRVWAALFLRLCRRMPCRVGRGNYQPFGFSRMVQHADDVRSGLDRDRSSHLCAVEPANGRVRFLRVWGSTAWHSRSAGTGHVVGVYESPLREFKLRLFPANDALYPDDHRCDHRLAGGNAAAPGRAGCAR
jgi:hypothetical protein